MSEPASLSDYLVDSHLTMSAHPIVLTGGQSSAANILPILVKKGLIQDYHHKK